MVEIGDAVFALEIDLRGDQQRVVIAGQVGPRHRQGAFEGLVQRDEEAAVVGQRALELGGHRFALDGVDGDLFEALQ